MAQAVHGQPFGKTEMWYVVSADKDAHLMSGLSTEITPDEYVSRVESNTITDVLCDYKVASGDVFFCQSLFMPADLTAGTEYNSDHMEDNMWGYNGVAGKPSCRRILYGPF